MPNTDLSLPFGQRVSLPGHFDVPVILEDARALGENGSGGYECRVRLPDGSLDEAVISIAEAKTLFAATITSQTTIQPVDAECLRLLIESARIRLAYAHDRQFAVSLSGIRTLPHQVEAVYQHMLPQPRLRFLLADDPGAGKTIMAGLLIKELKLREAIERVLILCPAPLTIQWQDEMLRWFSEPFDIIFAAVDQQQLVNPWQRSSQVVASLDYAKQDDVRERVWQQQWDLVIIDEAHKCSAYTKSQTGRSDEPSETKRYQLAKRLTVQANHVVLLTATPHHGDEDRFAHFLRLLDPDLFPEPHRVGRQAAAIRRNVFQLGTDCPWALRRLKEDLRDLNGRRLFPDRHAHTVSFCLNGDEYLLYKAVTNYINEFLPQQSGQRRSSAALARTVLQRRLASSIRAIHESLKRRLQKQQGLLEELESMTLSQRARRLAALQGKLADAEQEEDDLDDAARDALVDEYTAALELDHLQREVAALKDLAEQARRVRELGTDSKLAALKQCLSEAQFVELKDGRGKLLIFTEHRDTLNAVRENMVKWGYSTCEIHGGLNPHERKRAQEEFRSTAQICIATEAAGEGINLQFCHLMINYDMPWNPTRLEQRLGRIHRIGQERDVHVFNFVATDSEEGEPIIEGRILHRLLEKLDQMRDALAGRVFDVIGEVLSLNDVNLPEMLR
jgi:SNF2 family DNA or RNA helicase